LPVSETIVDTTRSALSMIHVRMRIITCARASKPSACQAGCAARPTRAASAIRSAERSGTWAITSPVAGFSTGISAPTPWPSALLAAVASTLAMVVTLLRRLDRAC
jgi:hypothetical protein